MHKSITNEHITYKLIVIGIVFLLGFYFIYRTNDIEAFTNDNEYNSTGDNRDKIAKNCPDVLIQKGSELFLYNSKRASVPGINPIRFENLDEYVEFTEWQRSQGILCPILYLQHAYNAQGDSVYKARPSPTNLKGGLPDYYVTDKILSDANIVPPPSNDFSIAGTGPGAGLGPGQNIPTYDPNERYNIIKNDTYPGFDAHNQNVGDNTPMDKMFNDSSNKVSPNPMDHNWGGVEYTEKLVASGYYADRSRKSSF